FSSVAHFRLIDTLNNILLERNIYIFLLLGRLLTEKKNVLYFQCVCCVQAVFRLYDVEGRGAVPAQQLRDALHSAGYTVNAHVLNVLAHRYGGSDGYIQFDDFIMCAVRLKTMIGECSLIV
ncbi:hypothetical protein O3G_MSEX001011, partial [Manduca sexta]